MSSHTTIDWTGVPFPRKRNLCALWRKWLSDPKHPQLDRWIAAEMKAHREFGKADRRFYSDMLFAAARYALPAAASIRSGKPAADPQWLADAELLSSPAVLVRECAALDADAFFAALCPLLVPSPADGLPLRGELALHGIFTGYESDILRRAELSGWSEADILSFIRAHRTRPPLWIRPNREGAAGEIADECSRRGFSCEAVGPALRIEGDTAVYEFESKKKGLFEIQDYASAMIGEACDVHPGMIVWDACAGGGGKTMQIASRLSGRGCVYASDLRQYKLDETKLRARAAGFPNVRTLAWNGETLPAFPKEVTAKKGFHRVLVDAPCSSSGTWRRNPDAKMRLDREALAELSRLQLSILTAASRTVRRDGLLVYATCSFLPSEDEDVVAAFLSAHPAFSLVSSSVHGSPAVDADTTFTAVMRSGTDAAL